MRWTLASAQAPGWEVVHDLCNHMLPVITAIEKENQEVELKIPLLHKGIFMIIRHLFEVMNIYQFFDKYLVKYSFCELECAVNQPK